MILVHLWKQEHALLKAQGEFGEDNQFLPAPAAVCSGHRVFSRG